MKNILCLFVLGLCILLIACNDSDNTLSNLYESSQNTLRSIQSDNELKQYISKSIQARRTQRSLAATSDAVSTPNFDNTAGGESGAANNYSGTNLIEKGADESDFTKYDGELLYTLSSSTQMGPLDDVIDSNNHLRIFRTNSDNPSAELVQDIELNFSDNTYVDGMYLTSVSNGNAKSILIIASSYYYYYLDDIFLVANTTSANDTTTSEHGWTYSGYTELAKYTQNAAGEFVETARLKISGQYLDSRVIDGRLIISKVGMPQSPVIDGMLNEEIDNYVMATDINELLPELSFNSGTASPAFSSSDCKLPGLSNLESFHPQLLYFASVSIDNIEDINFLCILSESGDFYASPNSVFVTNYHDGETLIHYTSINGSTLSYQGTAKVKGYIGQAEFRLSEFNSMLRAVSSWQDDRDFTMEHGLTIFSLNDIERNVLKELSQLPNDIHPQPIGKPREDIYAVRFLKDKAFIVTFERIDPFYVIDLSNPADPVIAGELEIPGFSTMLQPLNDDLILGVGRSVDNTKLELFDVSNPQAPRSSAVYEIEHDGTYSEAAWDHHALSLLYLTGSPEVRVTMPINYYDGTGTGFWSVSSLLLFTVGLDDSELRFDGELSAGDMDYQNFYFGKPRSIIADDKVYFISGGRLWSSYWHELSVLWEQGS